MRFSRFPITQPREQQQDTANTSAYPSQAIGAAQTYSMISTTQSTEERPDPVNTNAYPFQTTGAAQTYMVSSREQRQGPVITSTSAFQTASAQQANATDSSVPLNMMPSQYSHLSYQTSGQSMMASSFGNNFHQYYQAAQDTPYSYTNQFIQYQQALPESLSFQERQQEELSPSQNSNVPLEMASQADAQEQDSPPVLYYFEKGSDSALKYIGK